jgi:hypothetical protein
MRAAAAGAEATSPGGGYVATAQLIKYVRCDSVVLEANQGMTMYVGSTASDLTNTASSVVGNFDDKPLEPLRRKR